MLLVDIPVVELFMGHRAIPKKDLPGTLLARCVFSQFNVREARAALDDAMDDVYSIESRETVSPRIDGTVWSADDWVEAYWTADEFIAWAESFGAEEWTDDRLEEDARRLHDHEGIREVFPRALTDGAFLWGTDEELDVLVQHAELHGGLVRRSVMPHIRKGYRLKHVEKYAHALMEYYPLEEAEWLVERNEAAGMVNVNSIARVNGEVQDVAAVELLDDCLAIGITTPSELQVFAHGNGVDTLSRTYFAEVHPFVKRMRSV